MPDRITAAAIIQALGGKGNSAKCPAHEDDEPSLTVSDGKDGPTPVVHCHAGCPQERVIDALKARKLWPDASKQKWELIREWLYRGPDGERMQREWSTAEGRKRTWKDKGKGPKVKRLVFGGPLPDGHAGPVIVCEGAKTARAAARLAGVPALAVAASDRGSHPDDETWRWAGIERAAAVWIAPDDDPQGRKCTALLAPRLAELSGSKVFIVDNAALSDDRKPGWDLADWEPPAGADAADAIRRSLVEWDAAAGGFEDPAEPGGSGGRLSEHHLAEAFNQSEEAADWTYRHGHGWMHWRRGAGWERDEGDFGALEAAARYGRENCVKFAKGGGTLPDPIRGGKASVARGVLSILASMRGTKSEEWDAEDDQLGVGGGKLVDLRTGQVRERTRADLVSRSTGGVEPAAEWDPSCRWATFLDEALPPDAHDWLQRVCGYALTGSTREHLLLFVYGPTRTGKGSFMTALGRATGDYTQNIDPDDLMEKRGAVGEHPAWLADLAGRRFVIADEIRRGAKWNTGRVKALVSGEKRRARLMRKDFFDVYPQAQVVIAGNHAPAMDSNDTGMASRLRVVRFDKTPPVKDTKLQQKIDPADVLRWLIDGARAYAEEGGLPPEPPSVLRATARYREEADDLAEFVRELLPDLPLTAKEVRDRYTAWAAEQGFPRPLSPQKLNRTLAEDYALIRKRSGAGPYWNPPAGRTLFDEDPPETPTDPPETTGGGSDRNDRNDRDLYLSASRARVKQSRAAGSRDVDGEKTVKPVTSVTDDGHAPEPSPAARPKPKCPACGVYVPTTGKLCRACALAEVADRRTR